jgi:hypothetical protein
VLDADPTVVLTYARTRFIDHDGQSLEISDPGWHLVSNSASARLRYVIFSGHWVNSIYGLMRTRALFQTRLFPHYAGGDCALLGELAVKGKFVEIPDYLFFRRLHPKASSQNPDLSFQSMFFTGQRRRLELPLSHVCVDHVRTIVRSQLPAREKLGCLGALLRRVYNSKRSLLDELHTASKYYITSVVAGAPFRRGL